MTTTANKKMSKKEIHRLAITGQITVECAGCGEKIGGPLQNAIYFAPRSFVPRCHSCATAK